MRGVGAASARRRASPLNNVTAVASRQHLLQAWLPCLPYRCNMQCGDHASARCRSASRSTPPALGLTVCKGGAARVCSMRSSTPCDGANVGSTGSLGGTRQEFITPGGVGHMQKETQC